MYIEQASKGNIGYINEIQGEYHKSAGSLTDPSSGFYQEQVSIYYDAFDRALELWVDPCVVVRGRFLFNYSVACKSLVLHDRDKFKKFIHLCQANYRYATWKHRLFYRLRICPSLVLMIIRFKEVELVRDAVKKLIRGS